MTFRVIKTFNRGVTANTLCLRRHAGTLVVTSDADLVPSERIPMDGVEGDEEAYACELDLSEGLEIAIEWK